MADCQQAADGDMKLYSFGKTQSSSKSLLERAGEPLLNVENVTAFNEFELKRIPWGDKSS